GLAIVASACSSTPAGSGVPASAGTASKAPASAGTASGGTASGSVGFFLPEKQTARYEAKDKPLFTAEFTKVCPNVKLNYYNAGGSDATQQQQADAAIAAGDKVFVFDPNDAKAGGAIATSAAAKGIKIISYDRLLLGGSKPDLYVEFDSSSVGKLQGEALLADLTKMGMASAKLLWINGSPKDNNATLFKAGAHSVLDGKVTIVKEDAMANWKPEEAQAITEAAIASLGKTGFDGVYVANDGGAGGVIAALKAGGVDPKKIPVTGQDAELSAIQRIVVGDQFMTVYKPIKTLAEASADAACDMINGKAVDTAKFNATENNGTADIPTQKIAVVPVTVDGKIANTKSVMDSVVADGFYSVADICTSDYAAACTAAGVK
ncbi:MAG: substrate-binding domain-containing protein, partial [Chloroflexota bacterium]